MKLRRAGIWIGCIVAAGSSWGGTLPTGRWEAVDAPGEAPIVDLREEPDQEMVGRLTFLDEQFPLLGKRAGDAAVLVGEWGASGEVPAGSAAVEVCHDAMTLRLSNREGKGGSTYELAPVELSSPRAGAVPPAGAVVLFDGSDVDAWEVMPGIVTDGGALRVNGNYLSSRKRFGDARIHVEFWIRHTPWLGGQMRGNSGIYIQGRYELQILDSWLVPPAESGCGAMYSVAPPNADACLPAGVWQTFDIVFRGPRFDDGGRKTRNARITVALNGIEIHKDLPLPGVTPGWVFEEEALAGPLVLQCHESEVQFRNIWLLPLEEESTP